MPPESMEVQVARLAQKVDDLVYATERHYEEVGKDFDSIDSKLSEITTSIDSQTSQIIRTDAKVNFHDKILWLFLAPIIGAIGLALWNALR